MFNVSFTLEHEGEVHLFQQFAGFLRQAREEWAKQGGFGNPAPGELGATDATLQASPPMPTDIRLVDDAGKPLPPAQQPAGITQEDLEAATTTHASKHGVAATVALLAKYNAKRVGDIPSGDRARFYAEAYS